MSPEHPVRTVGRCIVCGDMVVEVADVRGTGGLGMEATLIRRCGCGDFAPILHNANARLAERTPDD